MPNLKCPLIDADDISAYREEISDYQNHGLRDIIIPLYLTQDITPEEIFRAREAGVIAAKAYPRGKTSHSQYGIASFESMGHVWRAMAECGMRLLIHPEHPGYNAWVGEERFFGLIWPGFRKLIEEEGVNLRISMEHISTSTGVKEVARFGDPNHVVATITAHHLLATIGDLVDSLDSSYYCKPVLKEEKDQQTLIQAAMSGSALFMLGSDSAPWKKADKDKHGPCAGCLTAPYLPQLLATVFSLYDGLLKLQQFTHDNAVRWWGLEPSQESIRLSTGVTEIPVTEDGYYPFMGGRTLPWQAARVEL
jgi:dihydroorotase